MDAVRHKLSSIFSLDTEKITQLLFSTLFQDANNVSKMFKKDILFQLKTESDNDFWDVMENTFTEIMDLSVYVEIVFRFNIETDNWDCFLWPFGGATGSERNKIYFFLEPTCESNIIMLQCIQLLILNQKFLNYERNIYGHYFIWNSFELSSIGNKYFDKIFAIKSIIKTVIDIFLQLYPAAKIINEKEEIDISDNIKKIVQKCDRINDIQKEELFSFLQQFSLHT